MKDRWAGGAPEGADELDQIVTLSNRVGLETSLVQPGGGNTSINVRREDADGRMEERLLASSRFRYTTGDIRTVDGGMPIAFPR